MAKKRRKVTSPASSKPAAGPPPLKPEEVEQGRRFLVTLGVVAAALGLVFLALRLTT